MGQLDQIIKLKDGRKLGYAEYGDPNGKPLFYFHGWPGSRLSWGSELDAVANKLHLRIIAPDRPGLGLSDFQKNRTILDWLDDVIELADFLKLKKFSVTGSSGGGPYVLACAYKIPSRIVKIGTVAGLGPLDHLDDITGLSFWQKKYFEVVIRFIDLVGIQLYLSKIFLTYFPNVAGRVQLALWWKAPSDQKVFQKKNALEDFRKTDLEALRQGVRGAARDAKLDYRPWGFDLKDIKKEVYLWHGELDVNMPEAVARHVARGLPNCRATFYPNDGHALLATHGEEILKIFS